MSNRGSKKTQIETPTNAIIRKWNKQGGFVHFKDGNKLNCQVNNLEWVSLKDAMDHITDWVVDWDMNLTESERNLVLTPEWRAGQTFSKKD
jgi:hypothetical protein